MSLGKRIVQARGSMSRAELVKLSGVPYPTLAGIENGDQQRSTYTMAIANALGVNPVWLETGKGPMRLNPSATAPENKSQSKGLSASQYLLPDPDTLHEALTLLVYDEQMAGAYAPRAQAARLSELIARIVADGGRLTDEHNAQFVDEVEARAAKGGSVGKSGKQQRRSVGNGGGG